MHISLILDAYDSQDYCFNHNASTTTRSENFLLLYSDITTIIGITNTEAMKVVEVYM